MSFVDTLRIARQSRVAVLHEFWTQYDPRRARLHAFFEGHDDVAFFSAHIERLLPEGYRLVGYRCDGKARVLEAFAEITSRKPDAQRVLFFVDKDLDDVLGTPWATDPRIFVTDVYSIENYLVVPEVVLRLYRDGVRLTAVAFDDAIIVRQFNAQLIRFQRQLLTVMAWILLTRRAGERPNLNNVNIGAMWRFTDGGDVKPMTGRRVEALMRFTGVGLRGSAFGRVREVGRELARMPAKRVLRGKFEIWFLLEFWKQLLTQMQVLAAERSGRVSVKINVTHSNVVATVAPYIATPRALELFLRAHVGTLAAAVGPISRGVRRGERWWNRIFGVLGGGWRRS